jgi:hypothetical protein
VKRSVPLLVLALVVPASTHAAGVSLVDAGGANHGKAVMNLARGVVQLKISGLAPLPAATGAGADAFTATVYKAYLSSSADPGVEIFLTDVYPSGKQRASRRIALGGDASRMGLDRVSVTAFSSDGQKSLDVLSGSFAP